MGELEMKRLLTFEEAKELLGIKSSTLYAWVNMRKIKHIKLGRLLKFRQDDIEEFIELSMRDVK
jgi:excisionase family DNA binding protein|tara:strand:+ start:702 stop:893 length:192 start_codon:yes stop_codon:yes gene_type:complete